MADWLKAYLLFDCFLCDGLVFATLHELHLHDAPAECRLLASWSSLAFSHAEPALPAENAELTLSKLGQSEVDLRICLLGCRCLLGFSRPAMPAGQLFC